MPQHFLKCSRARTLSIRQVARMDEAAARDLFQKLRWPDRDGEPECPHCGHGRCYTIRTRNTFKCASCRRGFSVTSGTIFHSHKLKLRDYLLVIALFMNAVKGVSALQISRDVDISYKAAFVLLHKLREAVDDARADMKVRGEVEIDGAYFGGHRRPANQGREGARPAPKSEKRCILAAVSRTGGTVTAVVSSENGKDVLEFVRRRVGQADTVYADEHPSYDALHARFEMKRINHRWSYSENGANTNGAESFFSRMRRGEIGQYHRPSGRYLDRYAAEMAYRSDRRRVDNGAVVYEVTEMALAHPMSRTWKGYWQKRAPGHHATAA